MGVCSLITGNQIKFFFFFQIIYSMETYASGGEICDLTGSIKKHELEFMSLPCSPCAPKVSFLAVRGLQALRLLFEVTPPKSTHFWKLGSISWVHTRHMVSDQNSWNGPARSPNLFLAPKTLMFCMIKNVSSKSVFFCMWNSKNNITILKQS